VVDFVLVSTSAGDLDHDEDAAVAGLLSHRGIIAQAR